MVTKHREPHVAWQTKTLLNSSYARKLYLLNLTVYGLKSTGFVAPKQLFADGSLYDLKTLPLLVRLPVQQSL